MNTQQLAYLLELLHANTFSDQWFNPMLDELRGMTNSGNAFLLENPGAQSANLSLSDGNSGNKELMNEYSDVITDDPFYHFTEQFPHEQIIKLNSDVYKQIQQHPIRGYYKYLDSRYVCATVIDTKQFMIAFAINRGALQTDYDADEECLLHQLIPHIKIASENRQNLLFLQNRMDNISQALESSGDAVAIIDCKGVLHHCSTSFYNCLQQQKLLATDIGHLQFRCPRHHDWLVQTISKVNHFQHFEGQVLRLSSIPLLELQLTMLKSMGDEPLFLLNLKTASDIPQWWRLVYQFTPKELLLIDQLLTGLTLPEIADQQQVSHNTLRSHLKHILSKVNCSSQNQLLVTLLSLQ
ncbi:helix-turn-helix transcriptional regulator [Shewanella sp. 6_MG-2023]|uniref:helix-turn-helix transcriptional regulator n=1 Tax=Shewanella sp. 6_MG-2023 TaxID=3062660 RepID=UPI0026E19C51|nr:helix-turn-helix transcriptional regulator [Shewanella sp. 6_MG-2023]MDO6618913.1 helix-turn-helix transcriptional regulator [Shewanella sp. 6_MG-2023]